MELVKNRKKWIGALRSGKYKQGTMALRLPNKDSYQYCCLGVAQEIMAPERWDDAERLVQCDALVMESLGLDAPLASQLIGMNDLEGQTFDEIADFLEKEWQL